MPSSTPSRKEAKGERAEILVGKMKQRNVPKKDQPVKSVVGYGKADNAISATGGETEAGTVFTADHPVMSSAVNQW